MASKDPPATIADSNAQLDENGIRKRVRSLSKCCPNF